MANVKIAMALAAAIDRAAREERMSKMTAVECGYDRSASLNEGRYVCTCGGACSHYDAEERPE